MGAGPLGRGVLNQALALAPCLVAADGGANALVRMGHLPQAVLGDLDSISPVTRARLQGRLHLLADQDSTDFDKSLAAISAPFILGLGFWGARVDHGLAALTGLVRRPDRRCILLGGGDAVFLAPLHLTLDLPPGTRLSLYPMAPVRGMSQGLRWPIDGISFAPDGRVGTSNMVEKGPVSLQFNRRGMLVIVPARHLPRVLSAFAAQPDVRGG